MNLNKRCINDLVLIFDEKPISRAYLQFYIDNNFIKNKILILNKKLPIFNDRYLKFKFNRNLYYPLSYLKLQKIKRFIRNVEDYFNLEKDFLINMYNFNNLDEFKNIDFFLSENVNDDKNLKFINNLTEENFLNTSQVILKNILNSNKNFFHIHPGYLYKVRGADGSLNSIKEFNQFGGSFYKMNKKIDDGDILFRYEQKFEKIKFENYSSYDLKTLYRIWFSFVDPAIRIFIIKKCLKKNICLNNFLPVNRELELNNYYTFLKNDQLSDLFKNKLFKI
jgi:hypothetical protein